ncbi:hypothetical protein EYZ49_23365 [Salmonella enterica subsp. salamae serovar 13,22:z:-]|uniref:hypothetical protein n=1 Tax=Salmonella enterica TaxID=28901 RepID=UPI0010343460|nr:hypothetical protein [Salmonella enterica]TBN93440.1 hypothetical protein EYZ49_23365 [Salmonella enterica subsp. salamae serovar 13,22:z:-]
MKVLIILLFSLTPLISHAEDFCSSVSDKADTERTIIPSSDSGYKVLGEGRAFFYSAPNEKCKIKSLFLIPGDLVNALADYNNYTYIMYFTKDGKGVEGWVKSNRLTPTGTGIGPSENN